MRWLVLLLLSVSVYAQIPNGSNQNYTTSHGAKWQQKPFLDVRDYGVDCTGTTDSATALNALFTNITSRKVIFPQDCKVRVESEISIFGQSGWTLAGIDVRPFGGSFATPVIFGCNGSAGPILHINRSALGRISGLIITPKGASCSSSFTQSVAFDNTGGGGVTSSDLVLDGVTLTTSTVGGALANYIGLRVYGPGGNLQGVSLNNVKIHCQNSTGSTGISLEVGTTDADVLAKSIVQSCFYGVLYNGSMDITNNIFSSNGAFSTFGAGGAAIRVNTCSSGPVNIYFNEVDSGGPFINSGGDVNNAGCSYGMNIIGNVIGTGDNATGAFPINIGTINGPYNVIGNTIQTSPAISQYLIGTASQAATDGPKGSLYLQGNKDQIPNNDLGWLNPNTPFQDGQTVNGNYGNAYGTGSNGRGVANGSSFSEILLPGFAHNNQRQASPFKIWRSYTNAANDDWTMQSVSDSSVSTFKVLHTGGPATTLWSAIQGSLPGLTVAQVTAPSLPGAVVFGGAGSTSWSYSVVAYGATGNSAGSAVRTQASGPATLDSTHYIQIQWVPLGGGIVKYCIWRTASGGTPSSTGNIGCTSAALLTANSLTDNTYYFNDTGLAGDSASLPASNTSGQIVSTIPTGLAPLVVASTTNIPNLNASSLNGATFASPGAIGGTVPGAGNFTTVTASSTITGTNFISTSNSWTAGTIAAIGNVVCPSGTTTASDCPTSALNTVGIAPATSGTINLITSGYATLNYDGTVSPSAGWNACMSAITVGKVLAQAAACPGGQVRIGIVAASGVNVTSGQVWLTLFGGGSGGGGGGTGTVTNVAVSAPLAGGPITTTGTLTCPTCAIGPGSSTAGHAATFASSDGVSLQDSGVAGTVTNTTGPFPVGSGVIGNGGNDIKAGILSGNQTDGTFTTVPVSISTPALSVVNPFLVQIQTFDIIKAAAPTNNSQQLIFGACYTGSSPAIPAADGARQIACSSSANVVIARFQAGSAAFVNSVVQSQSQTAAGTGWKLFSGRAGVSADGTIGTGSEVFSVNGQGDIVGRSLVLSGLTPSTSPLCPNGTAGALTTVGCVGGGGGGGGTVTHTLGNLTANAIMLGNGVADSKVLPAINTNGNGEVDLGLNGSVSGGVKLLGSTSGSATLQAAPAAGTPNAIYLPLVTGTANGLLSTNGANPQQTSWTLTPTLTSLTATTLNSTNGAVNATVGATTPNTGVFTTVVAQGVTASGPPGIATGTASNTDLAGQLTLSGGTITYTFVGTYVSAPICVATDVTAKNATQVSATTTVLTINGTTTDVVNYICVGRN